MLIEYRVTVFQNYTRTVRFISWRSGASKRERAGRSPRLIFWFFLQISTTSWLNSFELSCMRMKLWLQCYRSASLTAQWWKYKFLGPGTAPLFGLRALSCWRSYSRFKSHVRKILSRQFFKYSNRSTTRRHIKHDFELSSLFLPRTYLQLWNAFLQLFHAVLLRIFALHVWGVYQRPKLEQPRPKTESGLKFLRKAQGALSPSTTRSGERNEPQ